MNFEIAKKQFIHRFTMEHVPRWSQQCNLGNGKFYAPGYRTDLEWFENTEFYDPSVPDSEQLASKGSCYSSGPSWPLGHWLDEPYTKED